MHPALPIPHSVGLSNRRSKRERLQPDGNHQHREWNENVGELLRVLDLVPTFVEREKAPDAEQHYRHHECVYVSLTSVAKGVLWSGCATRPASTDEQQDLVTRVGHGVNRLGKHG